MIERHEVVRRNKFPGWLVGQPASGTAASRIEGEVGTIETKKPWSILSP